MNVQNQPAEVNHNFTKKKTNTKVKDLLGTGYKTCKELQSHEALQMPNELNQSKIFIK